MTPLQAKMEAGRTINHQRLADLRARSDLLGQLRAAVEGTTTDAGGTAWGVVYLPNVGSGHAFAGRLSGLTRRGEYRSDNDPNFGLVRLA